MSGEITKVALIGLGAGTALACSIPDAAANIARTALAQSPTPTSTVDTAKFIATGISASQTAMPSITPTPSETPKPTITNTLRPTRTPAGMIGGAGRLSTDTATSVPTSTNTLTNTAIATGTPIPAASFTATKEASRTPVPTNTPNRLSTSAVTPARIEQTPSGPSVTIKGVPASINRSDLNINSNNGPDADGVDHKNTLEGAEIAKVSGNWIAEPGVYTVADPKDANPAAWPISPDTQFKPTTNAEYHFAVVEGGLDMTTSAAVKAKYKDTNGNQVEIDLKAVPNNVYFLIIKNPNRDGSTPADGNLDVTRQTDTPSFTLDTALPPGQFMSEGYFMQNVNASYTAVNQAGIPGNACGADGCKKVTAVLVDAKTGAYTIMTQEGKGTPWKLVETNIK